VKTEDRTPLAFISSGYASKKWLGV